MTRMQHFLVSGWRLVALALLLVVSAHAAAPFQPLERQSGSAFSAATAEVSLGGKRVFKAERAVADLAAPPLPSIPRVDPLPLTALLERRPHSIGLGPVGPPPLETTLFRIAPRAPPAAA